MRKIAFTLICSLYILNAWAQKDTLLIGLTGSAPFVLQESDGSYNGISVELWEKSAEILGYPYNYQSIDDVSTALQQLESGQLDIVVGPISITSERAAKVKFTQPYFLSSLVIASSNSGGNIWHRIKPFFSPSFFIAVGILLLVLTIVGTLVWLAERNASPEDFPKKPLKGIGNGIWLAVVTMTTVGYGDRAPKTLAGRVITGTWMLIALLTATSLVAGISSTLTVSGLNTSTIDNIGGLKHKKAAVISGSTAQKFLQQNRVIVNPVDSLDQAFELLKNGEIQAVVYDRPQILYYLQNHPENNVKVAKSQYMPQGYGFATQLNSHLNPKLNVVLLQLHEAGEVDAIIEKWLGKGHE